MNCKTSQFIIKNSSSEVSEEIFLYFHDPSKSILLKGNYKEDQRIPEIFEPVDELSDRVFLNSSLLPQVYSCIAKNINKPVIKSEDNSLLERKILDDIKEKKYKIASYTLQTYTFIFFYFEDKIGHCKYSVLRAFLNFKQKFSKEIEKKYNFFPLVKEEIKNSFIQVIEKKLLKYKNLSPDSKTYII